MNVNLWETYIKPVSARSVNVLKTMINQKNTQKLSLKMSK